MHWYVRHAYFFHPPSHRNLVYIVPMEPMPMTPMAGCSSMGESGVTSGLIMSSQVGVGSALSSTSQSVHVLIGAACPRRERCRKLTSDARISNK